MSRRTGQSEEHLGPLLGIAVCCLGPIVLIAVATLGALALLVLGSAAAAVTLGFAAFALWRSRRPRPSQDARQVLRRRAG